MFSTSLANGQFLLFLLSANTLEHFSLSPYLHMRSLLPTESEGRGINQSVLYELTILKEYLFISILHVKRTKGCSSPSLPTIAEIPTGPISGMVIHYVNILINQ